MADKTFTQMTDAEFEQLICSIRGSADQKKYSHAYFRIECLSKETINLARFKRLLDALNENDNINSLSFSIVDFWGNKKALGRGIDIEGAKVMADFLKTNTTILTLDLSNHSIGTEGANALAEALQINQTLQDINLANCSIGDIGQIATALKNTQSIKKIILDDNGLGDEGAKNMAEVLKLNQTITYVDFDDNNVSDAGAHSFAEGLKLNNKLQYLGIFNYDNTHLLIGGIQAFNEMLQYNLSINGIGCSCSSASQIAKDFDALIQRNQLFSRRDYAISNFRKKLNTYSTPFKSKDISRQDLKGYLSLAYSHRADSKYLRILTTYSYPIQFNQLSEGVRNAMLDGKKMWRETKVNENNKGRTALELYQENIEKIKALQDKQFELYAKTPELKEKINKKLRDALEALDLAYYGRDAECLQLDFVERVDKLEAILKTTKNKAHQQDAKESLLPLYYSLMARTKDADEEKMYALSILACGGKDDGIFSKTTIAAQYQIENIEAVLEKRKTELKLDKTIEEENQPQETNEQKVYSNAGKSSFTKFPSQSEGATTNATPGAFPSPSST